MISAPAGVGKGGCSVAVTAPSLASNSTTAAAAATTVSMALRTSAAERSCPSTSDSTSLQQVLVSTSSTAANIAFHHNSFGWAAPATAASQPTQSSSHHKQNHHHHHHYNHPTATTGLSTYGQSSDLATLQQQQQQQQQQYAAAAAALLQSLPASVTHNLISPHLQAALTLSSPSLRGTPGQSPAVILAPDNHNIAAIATTLPIASIPPSLAPLCPLPSSSPPPLPLPPALTVQDRIMTPPVYNGVNPHYPGLRVVHQSPPIFAVDHFLTPHECDFLIHSALDSFGPAPVVGKGAGEISPSRTSSTCYLAREDVPDVMRKVTALTGKPLEHCELPQVGRYLPSQQYLQHYDAFDLSTDDGRRFAANGGQRTLTVLIYLNTVARGGGTRFPALNLEIQPRQGMAVVFFPATIDGLLDKMALHAALPAIDTKFVSQVWIRQGNYNGHPSKRLTQTLGAPFSMTPPQQQQQQQVVSASNETSNEHHPMQQEQQLPLLPIAHPHQQPSAHHNSHHHQQQQQPQQQYQHHNHQQQQQLHEHHNHQQLPQPQQQGFPQAATAEQLSWRAVATRSF